MSRITIVVPCYNEAERLPADVFREFVRADEARDVSFLFVNDGSRDNTAAILNSLAKTEPRMRAMHLAKNGGKAEAVRQGMLAALANSPDYLGYWDADLATGLDEIPRFARVLDGRSQTHVVFGTRIPLLGRDIRRSFKRHVCGRLFATAARRTLSLRIYDTQCGAKLFRNGPMIPQVFGERFLARWIFDVEILARWRCLQPKSLQQQVYELPLEAWRDVAGSKLKGSDFVKAAGELAAIHRRYVLSRWTPRLDESDAPQSLPLPAADQEPRRKAA
ncbi:MAG: glycosyltransferase [Pirellulaceae bacterium]|nr:glycosyltransferase [Planctomycetales bacterium]MCA9225831.1 glycosyltransferase [Planctomycetales bacterium]